jgi:phage shock protein PspC (stress-responsive transcriptional regulator)
VDAVTDDGGMDTNTTSAESTEVGQAPARPELVRPVAGRAIGGVAAGIAAYLNVSVGLIRVAFLIAVVFGGLGFALYALGWLLIRDEAEAESIAQRLISGIGSGPSWIGVALLVLGAVIFLANFTFFSDSIVWALVLVVAGYLLYRGDLGGGRTSEGTGESRSPPALPATPPRPPRPASPRPRPLRPRHPGRFRRHRHRRHRRRHPPRSLVG